MRFPTFYILLNFGALKGAKNIEKALKILALILLTFLFVVSVMWALFQIPTIQSYTAKKVANYYSNELGTQIEIDALSISFWNKVVLNKFYLEDLEHDTLVYIDQLEVGVGFFSWEKKSVNLSMNLIEGSIFLSKQEGKNELNYQPFLNYFSDDEARKQNEWTILLTDLSVENSKFKYNDFNVEPSSKHINYSHLDVSNLYLSASDLSYDSDSMMTVVKKLSFQENCGFKLERLEALLKIKEGLIDLGDLKVQTATTDMTADLIFKADSFAAYRNFNEEVRINSKFSNSLLDFRDLAYFVPELNGLKNRIYLDGEVKGTVSNLKGNNIEFQLNKSTYMLGDFAMRGLPDFENTFIYLELEEFKTTAEGLRSLPYPPFDKGLTIQVPQTFDRLGDLHFNGSYTGYVSDFVAYGNFKTKLGSMQTDILLAEDGKGGYKYNGNIVSSNFDIGSLLAIKELADVSFDLNIDGTGLTKEEISAKAEGSIKSIIYKGYNYQNIKVNGDFDRETFTGDFSIADDNLDITFLGEIDVNEKTPISQFQLNVNRAKLAALNLFHKDDNLTELSFKSKIDLRGNDVDDITGTAIIDSLYYVDSKMKHNVSNLKLTTGKEKEIRSIELESSLVDADLRGEFKLKQFHDIYKMFLANYIPNSNYTYRKIDPQSFTINANIKNSLPFTSVVIPELSLDSGTTIKGVFNTEEKSANIDVFGKKLSYADYKLKDFDAHLISRIDTLNLEFKSKNSDIKGFHNIDSLVLTSSIINGIGESKAEWNSIGSNIGIGYLFVKEEIESWHKMNFHIEDSYVHINNSIWSIANSNHIQLDSSILNISSLSIANGIQNFKLNGIASASSEDTLQVELNEIDLEFVTSLLPENSIQLKGIANGNANIIGVYGDLSLTTGLSLDGLFINNIEIGKSSVSSIWNPEQKALLVNGNLGDKDSRVLLIDGVVYPLKEENSLDMTLSFNEFPLELITPYIEDYLTEVSGTANGDISVSGVAAKPLMQGKLDLVNAHLKVDYLNTAYTINDQFIIESDFIGFNLIEIVDSKGSKAIATGSIFHDNYTDFNIDIGLEFENFFSLNTNSSHNDLFYGTGFTSGVANISGYTEHLILELDLKTEKGTDFKIPLSESVDVSNSNFVIFTNSPDYNKEAVEKLDLSGIQMNFDLDITPDAKVQIIFDEQIGDILKGQGKGELKLEINTIGDFNIFGQFVVEKGDYLFTLKNILNKKFDLASGSSIYWDGDPYRAKLDMQAIYNLRAPLYDLFPEDSTTGFKRRIPVELELQLTSYLLNPDIGFDIRLPTADENTKRRLESILYVNNNDVNRQEMNQQVFGLLVLNRFMPSTSSTASADTYSRGAPGINNGYEFISNQLSNWFSRLSDQFDVGVKYRPADELNSDEVDVSLSTQILNDRLLLDGNVGYSGESQQYNNQNSGFIGEFSVEYKLSKDGRYRVKGFNRSVSNGLLQLNSPYTQGVGLFYREEFDNVRELWRKYFKNKKKEEST